MNIYLLRLVACLFLCISLNSFGAVIASQGNVLPLTNFEQLSGIIGVANFDSPHDQGIVFHDSVEINTLLPNMTTTGIAFYNAPYFYDFIGDNGFVPVFPGPLSGGGIQDGYFALGTGVASFTQHVTQIGLTAGKTSPMFLTAWDNSGSIIGQVSWSSGCGSDPNCTNPSGFIGLDSQGIPIALVAYGNDDLFSGEAFNVAGTTSYSDTWVWATGASPVPLPAGIYLFLSGLVGLGLMRGRNA